MPYRDNLATSEYTSRQILSSQNRACRPSHNMRSGGISDSIGSIGSTERIDEFGKTLLRMGEHRQ